MGDLTKVLGDSPRVRLLEALVRLGHLEFTRGELAREADLFRMTTNRQVDALVKSGFIERVAGGSRPRYRVCTESPVLQVLNYLDAALGLIEPGRGSASVADLDEIVEDYRRTISRALDLEGEAASVSPQVLSLSRAANRRRRN